METHRMIELYEGWKNKRLTATEQEELRWLLADERAEAVLKNHWAQQWELAGDGGLEQHRPDPMWYEAIYAAIIAEPQQTGPTETIRTEIRPARPTGFRWLRLAASVVLLLGIAWWLYTQREPGIPLDQLTTATDINAGGHRATLTLADGRTITLDEARNGIVVGDENITYADGSGSITALRDGEDHLRQETLVLSTPRGGTYQVTLSDGSQIWLNSGSTLRYPSHFDGDERVVHLEGEGYFAITRIDRKHMPFKIVTNGQVVEVLGTEFNISAYPEDAETKTVLVEGSVRIDANGTSLQLAPGELGKTTGNRLVKEKANIEQAIAWKNGYFLFENEAIQEITAQLSKWYDVDFRMTGPAPDEQFNMLLSRDRPLSHVLKLLEETGAVRFRLKDREVYVSR